MPKIKDFFINNFDSTIYCLSSFIQNSIELIFPEMQLKFSTEDSKILYGIEIPTFISELHQIYPYIGKKFNVFLRSFSCFLIKKSYNQLLNFNQFKNYTSINDNIQFPLENFNYITIRSISSTSSSCIDLIYNIENERLFTIKKKFDESNKKYIQKEIDNYLLLHHPFMPKYYGYIKNSNTKFIIMEFINGRPLSEIKKLKLNEIEKINIIFQLLIIFQYIHSKNQIYRDLKPNNILITNNKIAILIDFESMIDSDTSCYTRDFVPDYSSPEMNNSQQNPSNISYKTDIYSLGMIFYFILTENNPKFDRYKKLSFENFPEKYSKMKDMIIKCTDFDPKNRPTEFSLMKDLYFSYLSNLGPNENGNLFVEILEKDFENCKYKSEFNAFLGILYYDGKYVNQDIDKGLSYFIKGKSCNDTESINILKLHYVRIIFFLYERMRAFLFLQGFCSIFNYNLGEHYYDLKLYDQSIIHFTKSAEYGYIPARFFLGIVYYEGKIVKQDMQKAFYHFEIAANSGDIDTQHILGNIYYENKIFSRAIHYYQLAANNGNVIDQEFLGLLYLFGRYVTKDVQRAIYLFSLANSNEPSPKYDYYIAMAYIENLPNEIEKGIQYLKKSAHNLYPEALFQLGYYYKCGKYVKQDINKAIHYLKLASDKNLAKAMYFLGECFYEGLNHPRDIYKAINYFKLAAQRNYFPAYNMLSEIYINGIWIDKNIDYGLKCLQISAENHCVSAQFALGYLYYEGIKVKRNIQKAIDYYKMDSNLNNEYAQNNLGVIYKNGIEVDKNIYEAIFYFNKAIKKGNLISFFNLAHIYFYGEDIKADYDMSIKLLIESKSTFIHILLLLCLAIIQKYGSINPKIIKKEYEKYKIDYNPRVYQEFLNSNMNQKEFYDIFYNKLKKMSLIHTLMYKFIISNEDLFNNINDDYFYQKEIEKQKMYINKEFYQGFGIDV